MNTTTRQALGWMTVFLSAFCFYISTVIIRWSQSEAVIAPSYFVFGRFLLGFLVVCIIMIARKGFRWQGLIGVAACLGIYFKTKNLLLTMISGVLTVYLIRLLC